jgi:chemotaxis protein MotA
MIGLALTLVFVLLIISMRGSGATALFDPHAFLIVCGGATVASSLAYGPSLVLRFPKLVFLAATAESPDATSFAAVLVKAAERIRASGRQAALSKEVNDPMLKTGLGFIAAGFSPHEIRSLLEAELLAMQERHHTNIRFVESLGGYTPTFGILGTVEAMVHILGHLATPEQLGPEIALAMVATLYGVGFANLLFLPIAGRLRTMSDEELVRRQLAIQIIVRLSLPPDTRQAIASKIRKKLPKDTGPLPQMDEFEEVSV